MGVLTCNLFTKPKNDRLEQCALRDSQHITPGSIGQHVRLVQIALNQLSKVFLAVDGVYGPRTAAAVVAFKEAQLPPLRQLGQRIADNIVGIRTIKALDVQMKRLDDAPPQQTGFISLTESGSPLHDHSRLCVPFLDADLGDDGFISHRGTPINPQGFGRKVCIGGTNEVKYLGFENFVPDPREDPEFKPEQVQGRQLTNSIRNHTASDICFRSAPVDKFMMGTDPSNPRPSELKRIAARGCRLTIAGETNNVAAIMPFLLSLGPQIQSAIIPSFKNQDPFDLERGLSVVVFSMLNID